MSYVVLARKYRPRSFSQMVGQEPVVRALTHALQQQRLHHAYLFTGTRGIGKTTVSRILAKSLNCTGPDGTGGITAQPCGVCAACTEIDADRFVDYIELDAASNRGIDEARELIERAAYKPSAGRYKVFMIDEAHQLTKDAFNALLKTLEEPPDYLKFVLATTDPDKMLPTVLSRCLQFNLRPMAPETVREHLQTVLQAEGVGFDAGALRLLGRAARGSMRDALSLTDQAIAYGGGALAEDAVRAMLGAVDRGHALRLFDAVAARDGRALLQAVEALRAQGLSAAATLDEIAALAQQVAVEQAVPGALDPEDPDTEAARQRTAALAADELQLLYALVLQGRAELPLAPDEYAGLTMVLLRVLAFPAADGVATPPARGPAPAVVTPPRPTAAPVPAAPVVSTPTPTLAPTATAAQPPARAALQAPAPDARARVAPRPSAADEPPAWMDDAPPPEDDGPRAAAPRTPQRVAPMPAPAPALPTPAPAPRAAAVAPAVVAPSPSPRPAPVAAAPVALVPTPLGDRWAAVVRDLGDRGSITALVRELAWQAGLDAVDPDAGLGEVWRLRVERESLRAPAMQAKLQAALADLLGTPVTLAVEAGVPADSPALREAERRARRQQQAEATMLGDPVVRALLDAFPSARVVPGSIRPLDPPAPRAP